MGTSRGGESAAAGAVEAMSCAVCARRYRNLLARAHGDFQTASCLFAIRILVNRAFIGSMAFADGSSTKE
jgi:hypothetical protein